MRRKLLSGTVSLKDKVLWKDENGDYQYATRLQGNEMILVEKEGQCYVKLNGNYIYLPINETFDAFE